MSTAAILIIGNEILSGRTQDTNLGWLARELGEIGIRVGEARVIPDKEEIIINTLNECRARFDYVFTTGGIGPTHDDITTACVARAFGLPVLRHAGAEAMLTRHYGAANLNAARLKMADIPQGAALIPNPVSAAPGFALGNVYVMAGVPRIMQAMFGHVKAGLRGGPKRLAHTLSAYVTEGTIAEKLAAIARAEPEVEIGSYPFIKQGKLGTSLVVRSVNEAALAKASSAVRELLEAYTQEIEELAGEA